jgi:hypothetical protein
MAEQGASAIIERCRRLLDCGSTETQEAEVRRKARARLVVLSRAAVRLCELASDTPDNDPARTFEVVCGVEGLLRGTDATHRLLRQVCADSDGIMKPFGAVRRGWPFRELAAAVADGVLVGDPTAWILVPALREILNVLEELGEACG